MSTERVIVQRGASEKLVSLVKQTMSSIKAGNFADFPKVQLSALFTAASADNVVAMIKEAQSEGAEVILGDSKREGNVVQPHILTSVKPGMRIWDRESFGPGRPLNNFSVSSCPDEPSSQLSCSQRSTPSTRLLN